MGDLFSLPFHSVLWRSLGLTALLFAVMLGALAGFFALTTLVPWPWLETLIAIAASLGLLAAFIVLAVPVTAMFAGLYLDRIAELIEHIHYPGDPPGRAPAALTAFSSGLQFAVVALLVNLLALPFLFFAVGAAVMLVANAWLLSREYFEMISLRHLPKAGVLALRQTNRRHIFISGFIPAALALVPLVNLLLPLFATSYFTHLFKGLYRRAPGSSA
ncbi:MAG: EI24 domain-containing protein [Pseudomonadota bacterium]|nr:EI24 domain-containing protein [Pseudomonadota bacterium]